jgi:hypothetical protein
MVKDAQAQLAHPVISLAAALALAACHGRGYPGPEVYAAGWDATGRAAVWRNGEVAARVAGGYGAFYAICADGGAVHAGGQAPDERAFYWTSGDAGLRYLSGGAGAVYAICADGGRLYAAGFDAAGFDARGVVWGGDGAVLHDLGPGTCVYALAASDGHIYAAGSEGRNGRVWRDGEVVCGLDDVAGEWPIFRSVAVADGVAYAAGDMCDTGEWIYRPFWTRADDPRVRFLGSGAGKALSLQLSGGEVWIAGHDGGGGRVWRGPADGPAPLAEAFALDAEQPKSVSVAGGDAYTGGNARWESGGGVWRNSARIRDFGTGSGVQAVCAVDAGARD